MKGYQATTLRNLKQAGSGIHVMVEAMPLSGMRDNNGGFICSLAREGAVVPATIDQSVYDSTQEVIDVYNVLGRWNGTELEVHHAEARGVLKVGRTRPPGPIKPMYDENSSLQISQELARKKRLDLKLL